jgi:hypothetical protein
VVGASGIDDLTHQQIRKPFLGVGTVASIGFTRAALTGTLIVASDGLLKYTSREKIATAVLEPDLDAVTSNLVGLVRYPSGALPDDVAIVLCRPSS